LKESSITIGVVMVMIFTVLVASRFLIFEDIPGMAEDFIYSISDDPMVIFSDVKSSYASNWYVNG